MKRYDHGTPEGKPYFEGWYFRCVGAGGQVLAVIPAVHVTSAGETSCSIQVITQNQSRFFPYPASEFSVSGALHIRIGENTFSRQGMELNIHREGFHLTGRISFGSVQTLRSDIMGPFQFLPGMACRHSVFSMRHCLMGQVRLNGSILDFSGGTGYIEGDRGHSFPDRYLWTQCHFPEGSMMLSIAEIPMGRRSFTGCICAIVRNGKELRIATYRGAAVKTCSPRRGELVQGKYRIEVTLLEENPLPLRAPVQGQMRRTIRESACAAVRLRLYHHGALLLDAGDRYAGFEFFHSN